MWFWQLKAEWLLLAAPGCEGLGLGPAIKVGLWLNQQLEATWLGCMQTEAGCSIRQSCVRLEAWLESSGASDEGQSVVIDGWVLVADNGCSPLRVVLFWQ